MQSWVTPQTKLGLQPGSMTNWSYYATGGDILLISGIVWNLKPLAPTLGSGTQDLVGPCFSVLPLNITARLAVINGGSQATGMPRILLTACLGGGLVRIGMHLRQSSLAP